MFSGIISAVSNIKKREYKNSSLLLTIEKPEGWSIKLGDSIATNGTCLTVKTIDEDANTYTTELMPETLNKTYFDDETLTSVNLEQSLSLNTLMDGHMVMGHVDTVGSIKNIEDAGDSKIYTIQYPEKFEKYLVEKGSIAVDGISLTVVDVAENYFTVSLVDYTLQHTTIGQKNINDKVHLEFDILAKYIEKNMTLSSRAKT